MLEAAILPAMSWKILPQKITVADGNRIVEQPPSVDRYLPYHAERDGSIYFEGVFRAVREVHHTKEGFQIELIPLQNS